MESTHVSNINDSVNNGAIDLTQLIIQRESWYWYYSPGLSVGNCS